LEKLVNERPDEPRILLAILPPTQGQRRLALAIVLALLVAFLVMLPFARMELPAVHSFVPTIQMALLINDLFTSALLFAQFSVARQRAILVLATGYLFTALIIIPHALTWAHFRRRACSERDRRPRHGSIFSGTQACRWP
jgi:hypothetical protein